MSLVEMTSYWSRMGPWTNVTGVLVKRGEFAVNKWEEYEGKTHTGDSHVATQTETAVTHL